MILDECIPDKASKATTEAVKPLLTMSLRSVTNLKPKRYFSLLESLGLVKTKGQRVQVQGDGWKQLLGDVGGEATKSFLKGVGKRWVVRIGDKDLGGYDSVREQIKARECLPPRHPQSSTITRKLCREIQDVGVEMNSDSSGSENDVIVNAREGVQEANTTNITEVGSETHGAVSDGSGNCETECYADDETEEIPNEADGTVTATARNPDEGEVDDDVNSKITSECLYPILLSLGISTDLRIPENDQYVKSLLGELISLQTKSKISTTSTNKSKGHVAKNTIEYALSSNGTTARAVTLRSHKNEAAFKAYHKKNPYIEDAIRSMGGDASSNVGARRLDGYIARKMRKTTWRQPKTKDLW